MEAEVEAEVEAADLEAAAARARRGELCLEDDKGGKF